MLRKAKQYNINTIYSLNFQNLSKAMSGANGSRGSRHSKGGTFNQPFNLE